MPSQDMALLGSVVSDIANGPSVRGGGHAALTEALLRRLSEKGLTLEQCADRRVMKRSVRTLQKYCRRFEIAFPDYVPMKMRPKKGRASDAA